MPGSGTTAATMAMIPKVIAMTRIYRAYEGRVQDS
jgi:hypothetical protein